MNKFVNKYPVFGSSVDASQLSLTVKGALGLIVMILVGIGLNQIELNLLADQITNFIVIATELVSLGVTIYGAIRKLINQVK